MREVVVVSATRTPIGSIGGTLKDTLPEALLATVYEEAIKRAGIDKSMIDEVIAGSAKQTTDAPNIARVAALKIRVPESVPAYTVHRQCASGMQAVLSGYLQVASGYSDVVLVGGVESMSTAPFYIRGARFGVGNGNNVFVDPNIESQPKSQPEDIYGTFNMIQTADNVAEKYGITREECDAFGLASQQKAAAAIDAGRFKEEITPVYVPRRKQEPLCFDTDEYPRRDTRRDGNLRLTKGHGFVHCGPPVNIVNYNQKKKSSRRATEMRLPGRERRDSDMDYQFIIYEKAEGIATITINRPALREGCDRLRRGDEPGCGAGI